MINAGILEQAGVSSAWLALVSRHQVAPLTYLPFWGPIPTSGSASGKGCLCQWWPATIVWEGNTFATAEHFMMAAKARLFGDHAIHARIAASHDPAEAQYLGRKVSGYDEGVWSAARYAIVEQGNWLKFSQHPELASYLLSTERQVLVSANPTDTIWSIGRNEDHPDVAAPARWRGANLLGFALMAVRSRLRTALWQQRLQLLPTQGQDLPLLWVMQSDEQACRCAGVVARSEADFMRHWSQQLQDPQVLSRSLFLDGELMGHLVCYRLHEEWHIGYWLHRDRWQQGIMTAALTMFLPLCPPCPLFAWVAHGNQSSVRVLEKQGFIAVGEANSEHHFRRAAALN